MKNGTLALALTLAATASVALTGPAFAQAATRIQQNNFWGSYSHQSNGGKVCYVLSMPTDMEPKEKNGRKVDHGDVFFMLAQHPGQNVSFEPQFKTSYSFKEGTKVVVDIDGKKFSMFTEGKNAWMENPAEDSIVVEAMKAGREMSVYAESSAGTKTHYKLSLSGVTASLQDIQNCQ